MKIILDAMGGDYAPEAIVAGAIDAVKEFNIKVTLVGQKKRVEEELNKYNYSSSKIDIVEASEVIDMNEPATVSIRKKKNSSIAVGIRLLKESSHHAFISAGNTGAVVCASTVHLGMIKGVERPAIGLVVPTLKKFGFLIDVGANTDPKPEHLLQSALMANVYAREVLSITHPTIGLLNIGEEASKGTGFQKEAHRLLDERLSNFKGNVEANEIFTGRCDCVVCDGFVGNIVIKVSESLMESASELLRQEIKKSPIAFLGAILMKSRLQHIKRYADYSEYGGAPLLGVNGIVMISHGRSSSKAIKNAIKAAQREVEHNIISIVTREVTLNQ